MGNEKIIMVLPPVLPHGWKKAVAQTLNIHQNTITKHLRRGHGDQYERIMKVAREKFGTPKK